MPIEIERRLLVRSDDWRSAVSSCRRYRQSYLSRAAKGSLRVRRADDIGAITAKGPREGFVRDEFEYGVPALHVEPMLRHLCVTHPGPSRRRAPPTMDPAAASPSPEV